MNQLLSYLLSRRSVSARFLTGPEPSSEHIETMLTIASRVPDHGKLCPWRFVVLKGAARDNLGIIVARLAKIKQGIEDSERLQLEQSRFHRAPLVIAVISKAILHPKIPVWEQQLSAGAVCMNLLSAASALGYGACWLTEWMAYDAEFCHEFGLNEHETIAGFIYIGHTVEQPSDRPRPKLEEIVTYWPSH
jgi:nitroreductase